jgi:type IV secretory pathway VirB2 component (pilin)
LVLLATPLLAHAASPDFGGDISADDQARFDEILSPVMKIYDLVKYVASAIAVIFLLFAGISYMTAGSNPIKRDQAKNMAAYVIIGLVIIWAAPFIVSYLIG